MWFFGLDKESRAKKEIEEIRLHYVDVGKYQFEKEWLEFWPYRYSEYVKDEETFKKAVKNNEINGAMLYTMHENLANAVKKCTLDLSRRHFEDRLRQVDRPLNQMREKAQNFCNEYYKDYKFNIKQRKAVLQEAKIYGDFLATLYPEKSTAEKTKNLINTELELYDFYENNNHIFSKKKITSFKHLTANFANNVAKFSDYLAKIDKNNMLCVFCCNKCKALIPACVEYFKNDFEEIEKQLNSITNKNQFEQFVLTFKNLDTDYIVLTNLKAVDNKIKNIYLNNYKKYQEAKEPYDILLDLNSRLREVERGLGTTDKKLDKLKKVQEDMYFLNHCYNYDFGQDFYEKVQSLDDLVKTQKAEEVERERIRQEQAEKRRIEEEARRIEEANRLAKKKQQEEEKKKAEEAERQEQLEREEKEKEEKISQYYNLLSPDHNMGVKLNTASDFLDKLGPELSYGERIQLEADLQKAKDEYEASELEREISFLLGNASTTEDLQKISPLVNRLGDISNMGSFYASQLKDMEDKFTEREREEKEREM